MEVILLQHVNALPNDAALVVALEQMPCPLAAEPVLSFGVEGAGDQVYRIVETRGVWETARLFDVLRGYGLQAGPGRSVAGRQLSRVFGPSASAADVGNT